MDMLRFNDFICESICVAINDRHYVNNFDQEFDFNGLYIHNYLFNWTTHVSAVDGEFELICIDQENYGNGVVAMDSFDYKYRHLNYILVVVILIHQGLAVEIVVEIVIKIIIINLEMCRDIGNVFLHVMVVMVIHFRFHGVACQSRERLKSVANYLLLLQRPQDYDS